MKYDFIPAKYRRVLRFAGLSSNENWVKPGIVHANERPLVLGPSLDPVFSFLRDHFSERAHILSWEAFQSEWDYQIVKGKLELIVNGSRHKVRSVYLRAVEMDAEAEGAREYYRVMTLLNTLPCRRIGTADLGISNSSKILHLHSAVREAARGIRSVQVPETLLIKSDHLTGADLYREMGESVGKSLSNVRTQVFDDRVYRHFRGHRPDRVPTLIQKKKKGMEVRVHCIDGVLFPLGIQNPSGQVDYRYTDGIDMIPVELTADEQEFCLRIQKIEKNPLIGVDFIRDGETTFCFEANPNPGWASFSYPDVQKLVLAEGILEYLEG